MARIKKEHEKEKEQEKEQENENEDISKSQRKRDLKDLQKLGIRLAELSDEQLAVLPYPELLEAIRQYRRIPRGPARKRQVQFLGKLLRKEDLEPVLELVNRFDSSSEDHVRAFHQLETWRERLVDGDDGVIEEVAAQYPDTDRQHLRALTRQARSEHERRQADPALPPRQFRKLFQYLKTLQD